MDEPADRGWSPRLRRVRPVYERHLAGHSQRRGRVFAREEFSIRHRREGKREIVEAVGRLDLSSAWELERELRRAEATDAGEILVDLSGLEFIDSVGMEVVIHASARARYHSKRLMISPGPEAVHRTFKRSGLDALLPFLAGEPVTQLR